MMKDDKVQVLSIKDASVIDSGRCLLNHINLTINKGEHWAFIGESGSGKTMLLNLISGSHHTSSGYLSYPYLTEYLNTRHVDDPLFNLRKLIAMVGSKHHFSNLAGINNFYYQQRFNSSDAEDAATVQDFLFSIKSLDVTETDFDDLVKRFNLNYLRDKHLIKLSNGESKRLRIAAALLKRPLLLLMDMPLTGLDVESRADFNQLLLEIANQGITMVLSSSVQVPEVVTHVGILERGELVATMTKEAFQDSSFSKQMIKPIDELKLNKLLTRQPLPSFDWIIKMQNVTVRYDERIILNNIRWEVRQGEHWALQGHNGSGKSTLLSLVNGDNPQAFANDIILFDRKKGSGESIWDIKKKIGFVSPELYQYFPSHQQCIHVVESGFYNTVGLFRASSGKLADICRQWMSVFQIDEYAETRFRQVPASIQRLCLLARAMVDNPVLLILDEPCQGLDMQQQAYFKRLIDTICKLRNITLVYVTHYSAEMPDCIDHRICLEEGTAK